MSALAYLSFEDLRQAAVRAAQTRTFRLDVADLAREAVGPFGSSLGKTAIDLENVRVDLQPDEIVVRGSAQGGLRLECEWRFTRDGEGVGYRLTFATASPASLLKGELARLLKLLDIDAVWWTASSRLVDAANVDLPGLQAKALRFRAGFDNFHVRFENPVLRALGLGSSIFSAAMQNGLPALSTAIDYRIALKPVLTGHFASAAVKADGSFVFDAALVLTVLGRALPELRLDLDISPRGIALRLPVGALEVPAAFPLRGLALRDTFVEIAGSLTAPAFGIGLDGRFVLPRTEHGGTYRLKYRPGNTSPAPDMAELKATLLTISDAVNCVAPAGVVLPKAVDRFITLRDVDIYYALGPDERSSDGTALEPGSAVRAAAEIFGQRGYLALDVRPGGGVSLALLANALRIGSIAALRGGGVTPPRGYGGPPFDKDAFELRFDTARGTARTSLEFEFLGQKLQRLEAELADGEIRLQSEVGLRDAGKLALQFKAGARRELEGKFGFSANILAPLKFGLKIDGIGRISGKLIAVQAGAEPPDARVAATLEVATLKVGHEFVIGADEIGDLAGLTVRALIAELEKALGSAEALVKAFVEGALKVVDATADTAEILVKTLVRTFRATPEQIVALMTAAGATAQQTLDLVRRGAAQFATLAYRDVIAALREHFPVKAVLEAVHGWARQFGDAAQQFAENLAWLLNEGRFAADQIAAEVWKLVEGLEKKLEAFVNALAWGDLGPDEVARQLQKLRVGADEAGRLIGRLFGTDILKAALEPAYGVAEAARVTGAVLDEMGKFSRNIKREVRDGLCKRTGICL